MKQLVWKVYGFASMIILFAIIGDFITVWTLGWTSGSWKILFILNSKGEGFPELLSLFVPLPFLGKVFWGLLTK